MFKKSAMFGICLLAINFAGCGNGMGPSVPDISEHEAMMIKLKNSAGGKVLDDGTVVGTPPKGHVIEERAEYFRQNPPDRSK